MPGTSNVRVTPRWPLPAVLLPLLALGNALPGPAGAAPDVMTILSKAAVARTSASFQGRRAMEVFENGAAYRVEQSIARAPNGRERIETLAPSSVQGRLAVSDGTTQWEYYPRQRHCVKRALPSPAERERHRQFSLKRIKANLRPRLVSSGTLLGRKVYQILVTNSCGAKVREAWVDAATYVELRADCYLPGGTLGSRTRLTQLSYSPSWPAGTFTFTPPQGSTVETVEQPVAILPLAQAEKEAGFRAYKPHYLPPGYTLCDEETALLRCDSQGLAIWTVYGNGLDSFSLFQSRCQRPVEGTTTQNLCVWWADGFLFTIAGQMERSELSRIKASVRAR